MEWALCMKSMAGWVGIALLTLFPLGCREGDNPTEDERQQTVQAAKELETADPVDGKPREVVSDDPAKAIAKLRDQWVSGQFEAIVTTLAQAEQGQKTGTRGQRGWGKIDRAERAAFLSAVRRCAAAVQQKEPLIQESDRLSFEGPWAPLWEGHLVEIAEWSQGVADWKGWLDEAEFGSPGLVEITSQEMARQAELASAIKAIAFETVSRDANQAVIRFRLEGAEQAGEFEAVRHGGVWLPKWLLGSAGPVVATPEKSLSERIVPLTERMTRVVTMLEKVDTVAEFDALVGHLVDTLMSDAPRTDQPRRAVAESEMVWVVVCGTLSESEKDQLLWNVASRVDEPRSAVAHLRRADSSDSVRIHVGPVDDLERFAKRLTGLTVERIEKERRTIELRLARDRSP